MKKGKIACGLSAIITSRIACHTKCRITLIPHYTHVNKQKQLKENIGKWCKQNEAKKEEKRQLLDYKRISDFSQTQFYQNHERGEDDAS